MKNRKTEYKPVIHTSITEISGGFYDENILSFLRSFFQWMAMTYGADSSKHEVSICDAGRSSQISSSMRILFINIIVALRAVSCVSI